MYSQIFKYKMNSNASKFLSLAVMLLAWISCIGSGANSQGRPKPSTTLPERMEIVEMRVNLIEAANYQTQINSLYAEISKLRKDLNDTRTNLKFDESDINYLYTEINRLNKESAWCRNNMTEMKSTIPPRIDYIEGEVIKMPGLEIQVAHLESVNKRWQANFRVINKTIAELRKKKMIG